MRKLKRIYSIAAKRKMGLAHIYEDSPQSLKVLETIWNNIPADLSIEDREVFYELSSQLVKLNQVIKKNYNEIDPKKN